MKLLKSTKKGADRNTVHSVYSQIYCFPKQLVPEHTIKKDIIILMV